MRRRDFITFVGGAAVAWPLAALAQEAGRTYRVGALVGGPRNSPPTVAMFDELRRSGFIEGQNLTIDWRQYSPHIDRISEFAADLVKKQGRCHLCHRGCWNSCSAAGDNNDTDPRDYR